MQYGSVNVLFVHLSHLPGQTLWFQNFVQKPERHRPVFQRRVAEGLSELGNRFHLFL